MNLHNKDGPVLYVAGADLADRHPIYDLKPYLPYADCHPDATDAFEESRSAKPLEVVFRTCSCKKSPQTSARASSRRSLKIPAPAISTTPNRRYGFNFAGFDVRFQIDGDTLTVVEIVAL